MKGIHSRFYGLRWLLKPLLRSEFMYPIARINNASLIRDPRYRDPWREGVLGKEPTAMCTMPVLRSSANHHPQEHFYWKEFISQVYQRCPPVYFPASRDCEHLIKAVVFTQGQLMLQTRCCLQRCKGDSFMHFHLAAYCAHQLLCLFLILLPWPFFFNI